MASLVVRLSRYSQVERDEITGGVADPAGVAVTGLKWLDKEVHFGVREQRGDGPGLGRLVAHAGLVPVTVSVDGVRLRVAGLGGVVVAPELRGRGLARLVVGAAVEYGRGTDAGFGEFGLLFCWPELIPLYESLGWRVLDGDMQVEQPGGRVSMPLRSMWTPLAEGAVWPPGPVRLHSLPM